MLLYAPQRSSRHRAVVTTNKALYLSPSCVYAQKSSDSLSNRHTTKFVLLCVLHSLLDAGTKLMINPILLPAT